MALIHHIVQHLNGYGYEFTVYEIFQARIKYNSLIKIVYFTIGNRLLTADRILLYEITLMKIKFINPVSFWLREPVRLH